MHCIISSNVVLQCTRATPLTTLVFAEPVAFFVVNRLNNTFFAWDSTPRATMEDNRTINIDQPLAAKEIALVDSLLKEFDGVYKLTETANAA